MLKWNKEKRRHLVSLIMRERFLRRRIDQIAARGGVTTWDDQEADALRWAVEEFRGMSCEVVEAAEVRAEERWAARTTVRGEPRETLVSTVCRMLDCTEPREIVGRLEALLADRSELRVKVVALQAQLHRAALTSTERAPVPRDQVRVQDGGKRLKRALATAKLALAFGRVERATVDEDGRPESDATHTVMVILLAAEMAREEGVDVGAAVQFAAVHDLVEAYCGDVNTAGGLSPTQRAAKAQREREALEQLRRDLGDRAWAVEMVERYEAQAEPAARLVRYVDKVAPKLLHTLNSGMSLAANGMSPDEAHEAHVRQGIELAAANPEFVATQKLFDAAHVAAIEAYHARVKEVPNG